MTRTEWDALTPREKDAIVAEKVMGWCLPDPIWCVDDDFWYIGGDPEADSSYRWMDAARFTASWDAMREVVEKMRPTGRGLADELRFAQLAFTTYPDGSWLASIYKHPSVRGMAPTLPEAVCIAALTALGHMGAS